MFQVRSPYSAAGPSLEQVVRRIDDISTIPQIAIKVLEVANDPRAGAADLKAVMESDAALSARVLRCVNSSAYATRQRITNLQQAIAYLGLKQIRNLAMTASVADMFRKDTGIGRYRRSELWKHLVSVGVCSRLIALRRQVGNFEDAFLAGLLHDLGIVLEDQHVHSRFRLVIESLSAEKTLSEVERTRLGFDHTMLGEEVARKWGFPESIRGAIRYHHASMAYRGEDVQIVRCVEVANLICTAKGMSSVGVNLVRVSAPALESLALTKTDVTILAEDLDRELVTHANLFQM